MQHPQNLPRATFSFFLQRHEESRAENRTRRIERRIERSVKDGFEGKGRGGEKLSTQGSSIFFFVLFCFFFEINARVVYKVFFFESNIWRVTFGVNSIPDSLIL